MTYTINNVHSLLKGLRLLGMKDEFESLAEEKAWEPIPYLTRTMYKKRAA